MSFREDPEAAPASADESERRSFLRAVSRDALGAAGALTGSGTVVAAALRAASIAARGSLVPTAAPVPHPAAPPRAAVPGGEAPASPDAGVPYHLDGDGTLRIRDRNSTSADAEVPCRDGAALARLLGRHALGSGLVLGELAAFALAGTASATSAMDPVGRVRALRATAALIGGRRPGSWPLADALRRCALCWDEAGPDAAPEALRGLGRTLELERAAAVAAVAQHAAELLGATSGAILLHGALSTAATGLPGMAVSLSARVRLADPERLVWATEGRPGDEGRLTAADLARARIPCMAIADAASGGLLASGRIGALVLMAESVDTVGAVIAPAGSHALAVLAAYHGVPALVLAPWDPRPGPPVHMDTRMPRPPALLTGTPDVPPLLDRVHPDLVTAVVGPPGLT